MNKINMGNVSFDLPLGWWELTHKQKKTCLPLINLDKYDRRAAVFVAIVQSFGFIKRRQIYHNLKKLNDVQFIELLGCLAWCEDLPREIVLLTFEHKGVKYVAPQVNMVGAALIEYIFADAYINNIEHKGMAENLFFTLMRPIDPSIQAGDRREKFDADVCQARAESIKVEEWRLIDMLLFFVMVKKHVATRYATIFPKAPNGKGKAVDPVQAWQSTLFSLADGGAFGTIEQVKFASLYEVLNYLEHKQAEADARSGWQTVPSNLQ